MIEIKKYLAIILIFSLILSDNYVVSGKQLMLVKESKSEENYYRGSRSGTVYSNNVPIYISVSYMFEEEMQGNFRVMRVTSINSCTAYCKNDDYYGNLSATASYSLSSINVSVYGTLTYKKDRSKVYNVNETFNFNI